MITLLIFSGVIAFIVYRFQEDLRDAYGHASRKATPVKALLFPVPLVYKTTLQKYFTYYQNLSPENKAKFERKVTRFIFEKQFIPRNIDEVTVEAKVLIAASAVQLTFGLPNTYLGYFNKILVYPNDYYSSVTKRYHKGEVNPRFGIIVLSWQSFVDGYIYPNDSTNLGLHEMAHALRLEVFIRSEEFPPFEQELLQKFDDYAQRVCNDPAFEAQTIFRPYACTNAHEFFSVAVENFFERSAQFKRELPELYQIMVGLLNQDPLLLK